MNHRPFEYYRAKSAFRTVKDKHRLYTLYDMTEFPPQPSAVEDYVDICARSGIACVIPCLPEGFEPTADTITELAEFYDILVDAARRKNITVGLHLEPAVERALYLSAYGERISHPRTRSLMRRRYYCDPREKVCLQLRPETHMSVIAHDEEHGDSIYLQPYVTDNTLTYTVPDGNWTIEEYICTDKPQYGEPPVLTCNALSFESSMDFLEALASVLGSTVTDAFGDTVTHFFVSDICFRGPNRRDWNDDFNQVFEAKYGFDPAPYYPALFHSIGEPDPHLKSLFMACRAEMLRSGLLAALKAMADRSGLHLITAMAEPKLPACSWLSGDALADSVYAPCSVQEKAYLYGMNSTHLAASAADNYASKYVCAELFRDYTKLTTNIAYKDALNAFGHGANLLMAHWAHQPIKGTAHRRLSDRIRMELFGLEGKYTYATYVARSQSLLRGGSRIGDIAMLYPIYDLHDKTYLDETPHKEGFEYPPTPFSCNYMTVLNTISTYVGQDITILHPETVNSLCTAENGILHLENSFHTQNFRILILPSTDMVSLENMRLIKKFFDEGGKIIATGALPRYAFEYHPDDPGSDPNDFMGISGYGTPRDREVREITRYIFGKEALNSSILKETFYNRSENGGEAYYIRPHRTAADGTSLTDCTVLNNILQSFQIPLDVYMPEMPRFECIGAFNNPHSEFSRLGLGDFVPGGGMISHIHKRRDDMDIYFLANSTGRSYTDVVYIRGIHDFDLWNPHTGSTRHLVSLHVRYRGEIYTRIDLHIPAERSIFLVSRPNARLKKRIAAVAHTLVDVTSQINMMESSR